MLKIKTALDSGKFTGAAGLDSDTDSSASGPDINIDSTDKLDQIAVGEGGSQLSKSDHVIRLGQTKNNSNN